MITSQQISYPEFFNSSQTWAGFTAMLETALSMRKTMRVTLLPEKAQLEIVDKTTDCIGLQGHWRTPYFEGFSANEAATKIVLPFLFEISQISIPSNQILSFGQDYRSTADFFSRNLFIAACQNISLTLREVPVSGAIRHAALQLQKQYFFVLKAAIEEPEFQNHGAKEIIDLFLANAHLPVINFKNPVLERSWDIMRAACFQDKPVVERTLLETNILTARTKMSVHF